MIIVPFILPVPLLRWLLWTTGDDQDDQFIKLN